MAYVVEHFRHDPEALMKSLYKIKKAACEAIEEIEGMMEDSEDYSERRGSRRNYRDRYDY